MRCFTDPAAAETWLLAADRQGLQASADRSAVRMNPARLASTGPTGPWPMATIPARGGSGSSIRTSARSTPTPRTPLPTSARPAALPGLAGGISSSGRGPADRKAARHGEGIPAPAGAAMARDDHGRGFHVSQLYDWTLRMAGHRHAIRYMARGVVRRIQLLPDPARRDVGADDPGPARPGLSDRQRSARSPRCSAASSAM